VFTVNAQTKITNQQAENDSIFEPDLIGEIYHEPLKYVGDQYFYKDWTPGNILLTNGQKVFNKQLKYNGLLDELIWYNPINIGTFKLDKAEISEFWLKKSADEIAHFKQIELPETKEHQTSKIFVQVESEGKFSLYIQRKLRAIGEEDVFMNGHSYLFLTITPKAVYYIKLPSNKMVELNRINQYVLYKLLPEFKSEIQKILKSNRLKLKKEKDLIRLLVLMNRDL
jgi:hypothetical protein